MTEPVVLLRGRASPIPDEPMHRAFFEWARRQPDATAVVDHDGSVTYRWLAARSAQWAARFRDAGLEPEEPIGVALPRSSDLVAAMIGVLAAGGCYVPLDPEYPVDRLRLMVDDAGVRLTAGALPTGVADLIEIEPPPAARGGHNEPLAPIERLDADQLAYLLYTSGSTGRPKGIELTHRNAVDLLGWCRETFGPDLVRVLASTSIGFDCSILEIFGPLTTGGEVLLASGPTDHTPLRDGRGAYLAHSVPSVLRELIRHDSEALLPSTLILGGEALDRDLADAVHRLGVTRLFNLYGPAEVTSYATAAEVSFDRRDTPPIGRPVTNTLVTLVDPGSSWGSERTGELTVSGAGIARGYRGRPATTAAAFQPCPDLADGSRRYLTGDLVTIVDGQLVFCGRVDDQLKVSGVRVELGEVEEALRASAGSDEVAVVAVDHLGTHTRLVGVVATPEPLDRQATIADLRLKLPPELVPRELRRIQRLPRLPSGKLDRARLADVVGRGERTATPPTDDDPTPAVPDPAAVLLRAWRAELGPTLAADDDVLAAGATSLSVLRVRNLLRARGLDLAPSAVFELPTVSRQFARLEPWSPEEAEAHGSSAPDTQPLSPNQLRQWKHRRPGRIRPLAVGIEGPLAAAAVEAAWGAVTRRQTALRARLVEATVGSTPGQRIDDQGRPLTLVDIDDAVGAAWGSWEDSANLLLGDQPTSACQPFLVRRSPVDHLLFVAADPIFLDTWSLETLGHQLLADFVIVVNGQPSPPADDLDYRPLLSRPQSVDDHLRATWVARLDVPPAHRFDGRSRSADWEAGTLYFDVPADLARRIDEVSASLGVTPYMVLLTALNDALADRLEGDEVLIGCPLPGRYAPSEHLVCGPLSDATVFRCGLTPGRSALDRMAQAKEAILEAFDSWGASFADLADLVPAPEHGHPVYQISFGLQALDSVLNPTNSGATIDSHDIGPLRLEPVRIGRPTTTLDLEVALFRRPDDYEGLVTYRSDLLDSHRARALIGDFHHAIDRLLVELCPSPRIGLITPTVGPGT